MMIRWMYLSASVCLAAATTSAQIPVDFREAARKSGNSILSLVVDAQSDSDDLLQYGTAQPPFMFSSPNQLDLPFFAAPLMGRSRPDSGIGPLAFAVSRDVVIALDPNRDEVALRNTEGTVFQGRVVARDHAIGLVAIHIDNANLSHLAIAEEEPDPGLPVLVTWLRDPRSPTFEASLIASGPRSDHWQLGMTQSINLPYAPAKRGAAIVDAQGMLVGMLMGQGHASNCLSVWHLSRLRKASSNESLTEMHRGRIGIQITGDDAGAKVGEVMSDSPAARADLQSGDLILEVDGRLVRSPADVMAAVAMARAGDEVSILLKRDEETIEKALTLAPAPHRLEGHEPTEGALEQNRVPRLFQFQNGKLIPIAPDGNPLGVAPSDPNQLAPGGVIIGNLEVERSGMEESIKKLEAEKKAQDEVIKNLHRQFAELEAKAKAVAEQSKQDEIARLEKIVEQLKRQLRQPEGNDGEAEVQDEGEGGDQGKRP